MSQFRHKNLSNETLEALAARFRALSEVSRLRIVQLLQSGEKNVGNLVKLAGLSQPNVSRHLQVLCLCGLIKRRKKGLNVLYCVADDTLRDVCSLICRSIKS